MSEVTIAANRGKLVVVVANDKIPVYRAPKKSAFTAEYEEYIYGPLTVGTATGKIFTDSDFEFIEVIRIRSDNVYSFPVSETIYLFSDNVTLKTNPAYDASKDTGPVTPADKTDPTTTGTGDTGSTDKVSTTPGPGRVPVTAADGKTVYVLVEAPAGSDAGTPVDKTKKWLTIGLYVVIGLSVAALITIMVLSLNKTKTPALR